RLAAGRADQVLLFDLQLPDRPLVATLPTAGESVYSLAWSPDGKWLAAGGYRALRVWDLSASTPTPTPRLESTDLSGRVTSLAFTADSAVLIAGDEDGRVGRKRERRDAAGEVGRFETRRRRRRGRGQVPHAQRPIPPRRQPLPVGAPRQGIDGLAGRRQGRHEGPVG